MEKNAIQRELTDNHATFIAYVGGLSEVDFMAAPPQKWNAAQQLNHLVRATAPVVLAFMLPKFVLRVLFGTANRPSRSYEELVAKYNAALAAGGKASGQYIPPATPWEAHTRLLRLLERNSSRLCKQVAFCSEEDLDRYILPHPLIGKLTLREMLYFTAYHVKHHQRIIELQLAKPI